MLIRRIMLASAVALAIAGAAACGADVPDKDASEASLAFTGLLVDQANVLDAEERRQLTQRLEGFQQQTGHQLAVVTVATLSGEDVDAYTNRLANRWGVGRKGIDDGVVLLVAPQERTARIAVGRGLETALPNSFCQTVMDGEMVPAFARGRFGEGIAAGVAAIIAQLAKVGPVGGSSGN